MVFGAVEGMCNLRFGVVSVLYLCLGFIKAFVFYRLRLFMDANTFDRNFTPWLEQRKATVLKYT